MMAEDPWCKYQPGSAAPPVAVAEKTDDARPQWTPAARARMTRIPAPLRPMVEKAVEAYARSQGLTTVTPAMMAELRARNMPPGRFPGPRPFDKN
ncbi:MAG: PCP reductase family protein [Anaerolineales bacterium]